jgi:hypothetical protein
MLLPIQRIVALYQGMALAGPQLLEIDSGFSPWKVAKGGRKLAGCGLEAENNR